MKIKIIDLLNKIANGEEVPKVIKYDETRYLFRSYDYKEIDINGDYIDENSSFIEQIDFYKLNNEIEIIEDQKKIEKIARCDNIRMTHYGELYQPTENQEILRIKINELIDVVNELKRDK